VVSLASVPKERIPSIPGHTVTLGDRAFPAASARAWNSLPAQIRAASSLLSFRRQTKAHLFQLSYN